MPTNVENIPDLDFPKPQEQQAYHLHRQGLTDEGIARMLGIDRITVLRRRHRFRGKVLALRLAHRNGACPVCTLLEDLK